MPVNTDFFVPSNTTANYSEHDIMDFPVGSVLVKTFTIPKDTSDRDGLERVIETRLLIHRTDRWQAVPITGQAKTMRSI